MSSHGPILDLARLYGWQRIAHFRPARTARGWRTPLEGDPGFPDLVLIRDGQLLVREVKSGSGRLTHEQMAWLAGFCEAGVDAGTWHTGDLEGIRRELR